MVTTRSSRRRARRYPCHGCFDHIDPERRPCRVHQAGGSYMTHRNELLALPLVLALASPACGDLQTPGANVHGAAYTSDGLVTAFLSHDLVSLDGELSAEKARIAYVGPTEGAFIAAEALSADGHVAAISWSPSETVN